MPTSIVALQILLILLPGFAAAAVVQMLALRGPQTDFDKVIESALYSTMIYGLFVALHGGLLPFALVRPAPPATDVTVQWVPSALFLLTCLTLGVSLAATAYINLDGTRAFRFLKLTERTSRRSVWNDIFQVEATVNQIVQVELDGNRSLMGVLTYYSDSAEDSSLFIEQARWIGQDGSITPVPGRGVLLTKAANIKSISLLDEPPAKESGNSPAAYAQVAAPGAFVERQD